LEINIPLLQKALDLRKQCAALLGYETWADYIVQPKMIKTGAAVNEVCEFLSDCLTL